MDDIDAILKRFPTEQLYVEAIFELLLEVLRQRREDDNDFLAFLERLKDRHEIRPEHYAEFPTISEEADRVTTAQQSKVDACCSILNAWGYRQECIEFAKYLKYVDTISPATMLKIVVLAKAMKMEDFIKRVNLQIVRRLRSQGASAIRGVSWNIDIDAIHRQLVEQNLPPITPLQTDDSLDVRIGAMSILEQSRTPILATASKAVRTANMSQPSERELLTTDRFDVRIRSKLTARLAIATASLSEDGSERRSDNLTPYDFKQVYWRTPDAIHGTPAQPKRPAEDSDSGDDDDLDRPLRPLKRRLTTGWLGQSSVADDTPSKLVSPEKSVCECDDTEGWKALLEDPFAPLERLIKATVTRPQPPCQMHLLQVVGRMGLREALPDVHLERIRKISSRLEKGDSMAQIRLSFHKHLWFEFTNAQDAQRRSTTMGAFKYMPDREGSHLDLHLSTRSNVCVSDDDLHQLVDLGYAVITGLPTPSWTDPTIARWADLEFELYQYHNRPHASRRFQIDSMVFSLTQQLLRQDPLLYLATVKSRPDQEHRLLSFPTSAQYAHGEDIQHTFLPGNHHEGLVAEVKFEEKPTRTRVKVPVPLSKEAYNAWKLVHETDTTNLNTIGSLVDGERRRWTTVDMDREDLLFMAAYMPKRIERGSVSKYRSLSTTLVALSKNGKTLENGHSVASVMKANQTLVAVAQNRPPVPHHPFPFPAAVKLPHLSYIGDALIGDRSHDDPFVVQEKAMLLTCSPAEFKKWYTKWRSKASGAIEQAQVHVRAREKAAFGEKSYFERRRLNGNVVGTFGGESYDPEVFSTGEHDGLGDWSKRGRGRSTTSSLNSQALTEDDDSV